MSKIEFIKFSPEHLSWWEQWVQLPHVKDSWFVDGYESSSYIHEKIEGNGYDHPFVICIDDKPIGYIQACDLYAYKTICKNPTGLFTDENAGTWCMDLFIADPDYLNKGYGTSIVSSFADKLFSEYHAENVLIDPAKDNKPAIRCYEKAGFAFVKEAHDGVTECVVMSVERKCIVSLQVDIRKACVDDLPAIVTLLSDDKLGQKRENTDDSFFECYQQAFAAISADENADMYIVEKGNMIIGVAQVNYIRNLTYQGGCRAQIEGVRIHHDYRGQQLGKKLLGVIIKKAKLRGCHLVQLTTDNQRGDVVRFYESLGFVSSHVGMKLHLEKP